MFRGVGAYGAHKLVHIITKSSFLSFAGQYLLPPMDASDDPDTSLAVEQVHLQGKPPTTGKRKSAILVFIDENIGGQKRYCYYIFTIIFLMIEIHYHKTLKYTTQKQKNINKFSQRYTHSFH